MSLLRLEFNTNCYNVETTVSQYNDPDCYKVEISHNTKVKVFIVKREVLANFLKMELLKCANLTYFYVGLFRNNDILSGMEVEHDVKSKQMREVGFLAISEIVCLLDGFGQLKVVLDCDRQKNE